MLAHTAGSVTEKLAFSREYIVCFVTKSFYVVFHINSFRYRYKILTGTTKCKNISLPKISKTEPIVTKCVVICKY